MALELGYMLQLVRNYAEAEPYFERAIGLQPDHAGHYLWQARNYQLRGNLNESREVFDRMPDPRLYKNTYANFYLDQCLYERNGAAILDFVSTAPDPVIWWQLRAMPTALWSAIAYQLVGDSERAYAAYDSARVVLEKELIGRPDDHRIHSALGLAYAGLGRTEDAIREGRRGVELYPVSKDALISRWRMWDLALIYAMVGEHESAFEQVDDVLSVPSDFSVQFLILDPRWDALRDEPGYKRLVEKYSQAD